MSLANGNGVNAETIATTGGIPLLLRLLAPDLPARLQETAAGALDNLATYPDGATAITAAGAIPLLVQLLGPSTDDFTKLVAAQPLLKLGEVRVGSRAAIAAAGASAGVLAVMQELGIEWTD
ncbi:hypothetical protein FOA52_003067 [Chlamydomonas sp. UWO 241]|nr:hypothetical protein FOA52_003067 [Chlamydomonas sp. UWO 241]